MDNDNDEKTISAEYVNIDSTLHEISRELKTDETLILDIGDSQPGQVDAIYDTLIMRGCDVKKSFRNGRNQIIVRKGTGR